MSEPRETVSIQVHSQGRVTYHQRIDSQVKFLPSYQKRVRDIFLDDVIVSLDSLNCTE